MEPVCVPMPVVVEAIQGADAVLALVGSFLGIWTFGITAMAIRQWQDRRSIKVGDLECRASQVQEG